MFHEMRRKKQQLLKKDAEEILYRSSFGVLALSGDDGYPYAVPISYLYDEGKLYFHCAKSGHKLDAVRRNPKASFCVVGQDQVIPEKYTTCFRSVIAFGTIQIMEDEQAIRAAIEKLAVKYHPQDTPEGRAQAIERDWKPLCMLEMTVEHLTGKEGIELVRQKERQSAGGLLQ